MNFREFKNVHGCKEEIPAVLNTVSCMFLFVSLMPEGALWLVHYDFAVSAYDFVVATTGYVITLGLVPLATTGYVITSNKCFNVCTRMMK